ncbi:Arginine N-methyltransferase 2 [Orbilia ellipsospora]|uniref:Arginine N-methyltransferase 2 n=1 Tax=Orbilia ellipsospora TaxID=2528407 RepID=A0AAV9XF12_9PEZI
MDTLSEAAQLLLLAAQDLNLPTLRSILKSQSPNVQDPTTLQTPLHLAILACKGQSTNRPTNGASNGTTSPTSNGTSSIPNITDELSLPPLLKAEKILPLLLQNGAIWNSLDTNNETPGCIANRLKLTSLYDIMVDAGVRAELLFGSLGDYMTLGGDDSEEEEEDDVEEVMDTDEVVDTTDIQKDDKGVLEDGEEVPELVPTERTALEKAGEEDIPVTSEEYLSSNLEIDDDKILDQDKNGVMMSWETSIMSQTVSLLLPPPSTNPKILNIGFGMGIIDSLFQSHQPSSHHIIEAHPQIIQKLASHPISTTPGVVIHAGRWQDVLPKLVDEGTITFDAIYFDTFAEDYSQLKLFFTEYVISLLEPNGHFGFFNGLGADRQIAYDVYKKVVEIDLLEAGLETEWHEVAVDSKKMEGEGEWKGVRRKYWDLEKYWLPVCKFIG